MDKENKYLLMEINIMVNIKMENHMGRVNTYGKTDTYIKVLLLKD